MGTNPVADEPDATRLEQARERLNRAVAVTVTGEEGGRVRTNLLVLTVGICLALAPTVGLPAVVFGLVALLLLAL